MKTVLIVDDTDDDVFFLRRALNKAGIHNPLQAVTDGQQAIDYLDGKGRYADRQKYALPFLILLDLKLPFVMGLDVLRWIRERPQFATIMVAVLTSSQQDSDIEATYRLGGNFFLTKPPNGSKLDELVRTLEQQGLLQAKEPPASNA